MPGALDGQVALITGAGRGIGRELALGLAREGMSVGLLGRRRGPLEDTLRECARIGVKAVAVPADVTRADAVREAARTVERDLGPVDLLINNAGRIDRAEVPPWEADAGDWWAVFETNLHGPFNLFRCLLPGMVARGRGRVVNLNSGFALRPEPRYTAYAVSKAALLRLTDNMAAPLAEHGVVVLDISPGAVRTDMTAGMPMFGPDQDWFDVTAVVSVVVQAALGRLDPLHGRFIHAGLDDIDTLLAAADDINRTDARTLRLRPYGPGDPVAR